MTNSYLNKCTLMGKVNSVHTRVMNYNSGVTKKTDYKIVKLYAKNGLLLKKTMNSLHSEDVELYEYNSSNKLVKITSTSLGGRFGVIAKFDCIEGAIKIIYTDLLGKLIKYVVKENSNDDRIFKKTTFDSKQDVIEVVKEIYDTNSNLVSRIIEDSTGKREVNHTYEYDRRGRIIFHKYNNTVVNNFYQGNLLLKSILVNKYEGRTLKCTRYYNQDCNLIKEQFQYNYKESICNEYEYDLDEYRNIIRSSKIENGFLRKEKKNRIVYF